MKKLDFRAVEIIPGNDYCALAKLAGKRMLYSEVLEVFTSSHSSCSCTFKHYDDRRHKNDRRKFDVDNLAINTHGRTRPYGRRAVDIHNRARDRFSKLRMDGTLQQAG